MNTPKSPRMPNGAPDPLADEATVLLRGSLADDWADADAAAAGPLQRRLAGRLAGRAQASARRSHAMVTVRQGRQRAEPWAPGVRATVVYSCIGTTPRRGEPLRVVLLELAPGAQWQPAAAAPGVQRDWLVLAGGAAFDGAAHGPCDYRVEPAGSAAATLASAGGARLYLREALQPQGLGQAAHSVYDAQAGWQDYAPLIKRRVLWQHGDEAALLYQAEAGAAVPLHDHGHDEECLMVAGDLFIDDLLLREGDYQLAPAGTEHERLSTDSGAILYAHGDAQLAFR